jgi:hypothetical protein
MDEALILERLAALHGSPCLSMGSHSFCQLCLQECADEDEAEDEAPCRFHRCDAGHWCCTSCTRLLKPSASSWCLRRAGGCATCNVDDTDAGLTRFFVPRRRQMSNDADDAADDDGSASQPPTTTPFLTRETLTGTDAAAVAAVLVAERRAALRDDTKLGGGAGGGGGGSGGVGWCWWDVGSQLVAVHEALPPLSSLPPSLQPIHQSSTTTTTSTVSLTSRARVGSNARTASTTDGGGAGEAGLASATSDEHIVARLRRMMLTSDLGLGRTTATSIQTQLEVEFNISLADRKQWIRNECERFLKSGAITRAKMLATYSDEEMVKALHEITSTCDLEKTTVKSIQKQLESHFNISFADRKQWIRDEVEHFLKSGGRHPRPPAVTDDSRVVRRLHEMLDEARLAGETTADVEKIMKRLERDLGVALAGRERFIREEIDTFVKRVDLALVSNGSALLGSDAVGLCRLNQVDPWPITYSLSNP